MARLEVSCRPVDDKGGLRLRVDFYVFTKRHFGRWWRYGGRWRLVISILLVFVSSFSPLFSYVFDFFFFFSYTLFLEDVQRLAEH